MRVHDVIVAVDNLLQIEMKQLHTMLSCVVLFFSASKNEAWIDHITTRLSGLSV